MITRIRDRATLPPFNSHESDSLDWKRQVDSKDQYELAKDMAALANASGGSIVVGVKEKNEIVDAAQFPMPFKEAKNLGRAYEEAAKERIEPPPVVETVPIQLEGDDQWVLAVNVELTEAIFCAVRVRPSQKPGENSEDSWRIPQRLGARTKFLDPSQAQTRTIEKLRAATNRTLELIENWQDGLERERTYQRFLQFLEEESHHDIRFPKLGADKDHLGLEYTVRPIRDDERSPLQDKGEMRSRWLIHVTGPAHEEVMSADERARYDTSPICDGENYYCEFFNDSWHLTDDSRFCSYPFYLSGKVSSGEYSQPANDFVQARLGAEETELTKLFEVPLNLSGERAPLSGGANMFSVFKDPTERLFLKVNSSPLKKMYMTNPRNTWDDSGWYFEIEKLRGHGDRTVRENIHKSILSTLEEKQIPIPKVPWHKTYRMNFQSDTGVSVP